LGEQTNNFAEYEALIIALAAAREMFGSKLHDMQVTIYMDSELVVRQLNGAYRVKDPALKEQFARVGQLAGRSSMSPTTTSTAKKRQRRQTRQPSNRRSRQVAQTLYFGTLALVKAISSSAFVLYGGAGGYCSGLRSGLFLACRCGGSGRAPRLGWFRCYYFLLFGLIPFCCALSCSRRYHWRGTSRALRHFHSPRVARAI